MTNVRRRRTRNLHGASGVRYFICQTNRGGATLLLDLSPSEIKTQQRLFGKHLDWPATPVRRTFLIMSNPRTGSSMLASALAASGKAGRAYEYLSPVNIGFYRRMRGPLPIDQMWRDYQSRRTSPNGYFSVKMHASHYRQLFATALAKGHTPDFLKTFDFRIFITRRDKVEQAISEILAGEPGGEWSDTAGQGPARRFKSDDVGKIRKAVERLAVEENYWRETIDRLGLKALEIEYEELFSNTNATVARVLSWLDLPFEHEDIPQPGTMKLPNEVNQELKRRFLAATAQKT